jgi:hypothetical protein
LDSEGDYCRPVLVVMEDRDIALFFEFAFDLKAAWCRDVFQIDTAE